MSPEPVEFLQPGLRLLSPNGERSTDEGHADEAREILATTQSLIVIDLEMSGPNPQMHEVLDVGGVRASVRPAFPEEKSWGARVKPKHIGNADRNALKVVRYTPRDWKDALELESAFEQLAELGRGAALAGWGIGQDMSFLVEVFRRLEMDWPFAPVAVDVQPIARQLLKGTGSVDRFNLGHVADRLGIGRMGEHGALPDAYATYDVLVKLHETAAKAST